MNKKFVLVVLGETVIGFGLAYVLWLTRRDDYDLRSGLLYFATVWTLIATVLSSTIGGLVKGRGNKWVNILLIIVVVGVITFFFIRSLNR